MPEKPLDRISVIVPKNPFLPKEFQEGHQCLCTIDIEELMDLWPGTPHFPNPNPEKVKAIQRSLDWKRVAHIASYLLQEEILDATEKLEKYFNPIYQPKQHEKGRTWPPKINRIISFQQSEFPMFPNVLLHVNGGQIKPDETEPQRGIFEYRKGDKGLIFSVIDGQHRINGAYFAICLKREKDSQAKLEIPAQIFIDLDKPNQSSRQAQIFIDVNFNQKKVDKSLVVDLYPTARGLKEPENKIQRSQDIGRKLMLETGPLVGMIQIPGINYGTKDVISLATLVGAIEDMLETMDNQGISTLEQQTDFISECLTGWLEATGRYESKGKKSQRQLDRENVVYQGRIIVSIIALIPAIIWNLKNKDLEFISDNALEELIEWFKNIAKRANLLKNNVFMDKKEFKKRGFLGSGGIARFRNSLWAVIKSNKKLTEKDPEKIAQLANKTLNEILAEL